MNATGHSRPLIDDRFELVQRLGGGGMGLVWRARDVVLHREVALKEVRPPEQVDYEGAPEKTRMLRERVLREARALARLRHPNVVTIHHIVDRANTPHPWLVMELVTGGSLQDRLDQGPLTSAEAVRVGRGVLAGLQAAHAAGVHHRDVKPANVLLREDGTPVLTDFGIAALPDAATRLTATGDLIGSPEFIAPERIRSEEGNPASDLWSLGMMLYVALEGHSPLRRATSMATLVAVLDEPIPPPVRSGPMAPVLSALLQRDPAVRPDAEQLDRLFAEAESGRSTGAPAYGFGPAPTMPSTTPAVTPGLAPHSATFAGAATAGVPFTTAPAEPTAPAAPTTPTTPAAPASPAPRSPGGRGPAPRRKLTASAATVAIIVGTMLWVARPDSGDATSGTNTDSASGTASTNSGTEGSSGSSDTTASADGAEQADSENSDDDTDGTDADSTQNLLTPAGMRTLTKALRTTSGGTEVKDASVYLDYAFLDAPTKANRSRWDVLEYRDGVMTRDRAGGTLSSDAALIDLDAVAWDKLPALLSKADNELGIGKPTIRYLRITTDVISGEPEIRVYVGDEYDSGYLKANVDGEVFRMYPAGQ
ncbi:serine/threonine-protein kinase [Streptomyces collinus]|uniref:serine/threonine-protein kinase n=1 Tax=Streptomyces collinus TaxID=42684 RepID=UPI0037961C17